MKIKYYLGMALVALALLVTTANAALFNISVDTWLNDPTLHGGQTTVSLDNGGWRGVYAGEFEANFIGAAYDSYPQSWKTYCTDLNNWLGSGYFQPKDWTDALAAQHSPTWTGSPLDAQGVYLKYRDTISTGAEAVGLQLAVWNLLYDTDLSVSGGSFRAKDGTVGSIDWANTYLADFNRSTEPGTWWEPTWQDGSVRKAQGLLGNTVSVPDGGGTLASMLIGLGTLIGWRRKLA